VNKAVFFLIFTILYFNLYTQNIEQEYQSLVKSNDYAKALTIVEEGIKQNPNNAALYLMQVECSLYLYSSNRDTSEQLLTKAFQSLSKYHQLNTNSESFKTLSAQLSIPIYRKAAIYMNLEQYGAAKSWFYKTMQLKSWANEKDPDLIFYTGLSAYNSEDFSLMEKCFTQLVKEQYTNASIYEILASYYYQNNSLNKAKDIVITALKAGIYISPETEILALYVIEKYRNCNEFNTLNKQFSWSTSESIEIEKVVGRIFYLCGDTTSCIEQYKRIYYKYPTDTTVLIQLGLVYYNRGIKYLQEAKNIIAKSDKNIEPYRKLKDLYIADMKSAIFYLVKALQLNVTFSTAINCLYQSYKQLQRKEEMSKLQQKYPNLLD
jgi:predicted Zn-dependent protease